MKYTIYSIDEHKRLESFEWLETAQVVKQELEDEKGGRYLIFKDRTK